MKINPLSTEKLRNDAHFQFQTEFKTAALAEGLEKLKITAQYEDWLPLYNREDEALKKIVKSEFTAKLQEADRARDEILAGISDINNGCLKHFNPEKREAAGRVKIVLDTYGDISRKPLNEQTSATYNILQEFNGKYAADIAAVGLAEWVSELEAKNNAFAALMKERFDETAAKTDIVLKDARRAADKQYKAIIERLNALIVVEGEANYESFARTMNAIIAKYAVAVARLRRRGGKEETNNQQEA